MTFPVFAGSMRQKAAALLLVAIAIPATAGLPNEFGVTSAGRVVVEAAAKGDVETAFRAARTLGRADDTAFVGRLEARQAAVTAQLAMFGTQKDAVQLVGSSFFAGAERREYRVRYASGQQYWILKFRPANGGWSLFDMEVISEPRVVVASAAEPATTPAAAAAPDAQPAAVEPIIFPRSTTPFPDAPGASGSELPGPR